MEEQPSSEAGRKALPDFSIKKIMCEAEEKGKSVAYNQREIKRQE